jgi:hypothetical protein
MKMKVSRLSEDIDALDVCFIAGLVVLGAGTWLACDLGTALMVIGGVVTAIGVVALLRKVN